MQKIDSEKYITIKMRIKGTAITNGKTVSLYEYSFQHNQKVRKKKIKRSKEEYRKWYRPIWI